MVLVQWYQTIRPRGQNPLMMMLIRSLDNFRKCEGVQRFLTFNCIFIIFTAFPIDKDCFPTLAITDKQLNDRNFPVPVSTISEFTINQSFRCSHAVGPKCHSLY